MKKGDIIRCGSMRDLAAAVTAVESAGFGWRVDKEAMEIEITGEPDKRYLVAATGGPKGYTDTLPAAREIFDALVTQYAHVEILYGYPGEWVTVAKV